MSARPRRTQGDHGLDSVNAGLIQKHVFLLVGVALLFATLEPVFCERITLDTRTSGGVASYLDWDSTIHFELSGIAPGQKIEIRIVPEGFLDREGADTTAMEGWMGPGVYENAGKYEISVPARTRISPGWYQIVTRVFGESDYRIALEKSFYIRTTEMATRSVDSIALSASLKIKELKTRTFKRVRKSIVQIRTDDIGTGFIVNPAGLVATASHNVVGGGFDISVRFFHGTIGEGPNVDRRFPYEIVGDPFPKSHPPSRQLIFLRPKEEIPFSLEDDEYDHLEYWLEVSIQTTFRPYREIRAGEWWREAKSSGRILQAKQLTPDAFNISLTDQNYSEDLDDSYFYYSSWEIELGSSGGPVFDFHGIVWGVTVERDEGYERIRAHWAYDIWVKFKELRKMDKLEPPYN